MKTLTPPRSLACAALLFLLVAHPAHAQQKTCILPPDLPGGGATGLPAAQFPPASSAPTALAPEGYGLGTGPAFAPATTTGGPDTTTVAHELAHVVQQRSAGGNLGGEIVELAGTVKVRLARGGKRSEAELNLRSCVIHLAPRPQAGAEVEGFDMELVSYLADVTGAPDFSLLRITGGTASGFHGSGKTTMTRLPDGTFACDSFFDITYRMDIAGTGPVWGGVTGSPTMSARLSFTDRVLDGQLYEPRGGAVVGQSADGLIVSNIGSSGQDGVECRPFLSKKGYDYYRAGAGFSEAPPESDGSGIVIGGLSLAAPGSSLSVGWGGPWPCAGLPENCDGVELTLTGGGSPACAVNWGRFAASQTLVEVWNGGQLAGSSLVPSAAPLFSVPGGAFVPDAIEARKRPGRVKYCDITLRRSAGPGAISLGGAVLLGDAVRLSPYDPHASDVNLGGVSLRGTNLPPLTLESLRTFVIPHVLEASGRAVLARKKNGGGLVVANLGSSGLDGVQLLKSPCCIDYDDDGDAFLPLGVTLVPLDLRNGAGTAGTAGGRLIMRARDATGAELAVAECRDNGGAGGGAGGSVAVDFSGNGATTCLVTVMNGGATVGQFPVPVAGLTDVCVFGEGADGYPLLTGCGKRRGIFPWENSCLVGEFDRVVPISFPGVAGPPLLGDTLLLLAADPTPGVLDATASFEVAVANVEGFEICDITTGQALAEGPVLATPGDYPGSQPTFEIAAPVYFLDPPSPLGNAGLKVADWKLSEMERVADDGTQANFTGKLTLTLTGVGSLAGYTRTLELPGTLSVSRSPGTGAGTPVQQLAATIDNFSFKLAGGDPDFDLLRVASSGPSTGTATARELAGGGFRIGSFFDIFTEVSLTGAAGGGLAGVAWAGTVEEPWKLVSEGMLHSAYWNVAIGLSRLSPTTGGGLIVSNIGSSGQDGVSVQLPPAESFTVLSSNLCPSLPGVAESSVRFEEFGDVAGRVVGGSLGTCTVRFRPAFFDVFCDFASVAPSSTEAQVYSAGVLVASFPAAGSQLTLQALPVAGAALPPLVEIGKLSARAAVPCKRIRWGGACQIRVGTAAAVQGDEVRLLAHGVAFEAISRFEIRWTDCAECVLGTEWAGISGREITGNGGTRAQDHNSSRSNKTASVAVDLGGDAGQDPSLDGSLRIRPPREAASGQATGKRQHKPIRLRLASIGVVHQDRSARLRVEGFGKIGLVANAPLGSVTVTKAAEGLDVSADFSSRGTSVARVLVFDDRLDRLTPITSVDKATPLLARIHGGASSGPPPSITELAVAPAINKAFANEGFFDLVCAAPVVIDFLDGTSATGTRLRVCVMNPAAPAEDISGLVLSGAGLKPFVLDEIGTGTLPEEGVLQSTVGGAQLSDNASGQLVVSNIGSSGLDGVRIDLGEAEGTWQACTPVPVVGQGGSLALYGEIRDDDCDGDTFFGITQSGELFASVPDFPTPVPATFVMLDGVGAVAGSFTVPDIRSKEKKRPGRESPTLASLGRTANVVGYGFLPPRVIDGYGHLGACYTIAFDAPVSVSNPGSLPFEGRVLCLTLPGVTDACYDLSVTNRSGSERLSARSLSALFGDNGPVTVTGTELRHFRNAPVSSLAGGELQVSDNRLRVANIGSSGEDGVCIRLRRVDQAAFGFNPIEISSAGMRAISLHSTHATGDAGSAVLGPLSGNELPLSADFASLGTPSARVVVLSGGTVVGQYVAAASALGVIDASAPKVITGCGKLRALPIPGGIQPPCYYWEFGGMFRITPPGGGVGSSLVGNELRVLAEGATVPITELRSFDIRAASATGEPAAFVVNSHASPGFDTWLLDHFTPSEIDGIVKGGDCDGDGAAELPYQCDHDHDGLKVIEEYAMGLDPKRGDIGASSRPRIALGTGTDGGIVLRYSYEVDPTAQVEIRLRSSSDLATWNSNQADFTLIGVVSLPNGNLLVTKEKKPADNKKEYVGHVTLLK